MLRSRAIAREQGSVLEITEWDRVLVAYLCLVSVWCWDYEKGVKEILEEGGALGLVSGTYAYDLALLLMLFMHSWLSPWHKGPT